MIELNGFRFLIRPAQNTADCIAKLLEFALKDAKDGCKSRYSESVYGVIAYDITGNPLTPGTTW